MCGIAGFIGKGDVHDLETMIKMIAYRGPDDLGVFCEKGVGLAHARLAVVDLSPFGHQPMWDRKKTALIVFNGEIYNFQKLRQECISWGYHFLGSSDTEVILALYEKYGEACIERLDGMFAIALYDVEKKILLLSRDRMGKKPLYYGEFGGGIIFASEPKAVLAHPSVPRSVDSHALSAYLALDYIPTPLSIYKGIHKLPPASVLIYKGGHSFIRTFWSPLDEEACLDEEAARSELDNRLSKAVEARLIADVPLGVFLSGGLDSSVIAYYASRTKKKPIHTFSIGFHESSFDESAYAKKVAAHLGTMHHHKILSGGDSLQVVPKILALLDEPMADASIIPTYLLAEFTREHVTVALGGDGGDELFAGYQTFQAERIHEIMSHFPLGVLKILLEGGLRVMPSSSAYMSNEFLLRKFLEGMDEPSRPRRHMRWLGTFNEEEYKKILLPEVYNELTRSPTAFADEYAHLPFMKDEHNAILWMYQRTYMMDQVMVKVDRSTMYNALEARAPFLDTRVVEFANALPYSLKLHGFTSKYLLKRTMEGKLPDDIIHRPKKGFGVPVGAWLRGPLRSFAEELFSEEHITRTGLLSSQYINQLWSEHQEGIRDHRKRLWNLMVLLAWQQNYS